MNALPRVALTAVALAFATTFAAAQAVAPAQKVAKAKITQKSSASRQQLKSAAAEPAAASGVDEAMTEGQLAVAQRVMTGASDCEFNQQVHVHPVDGKPGHFRLGFKNANYQMVPQETTTGAVRLEDKRAGVVWLQIPSKSMLMNHKIGQRMVDSCLHAEQRGGIDSARAAPAIGISQ